ncbi:Similar to VTI1A: Vesicle transport through interaction with t-SNAREs homolog 1A (Homo sapiens) [Cotesia congregata]|uniref:Similar to VTI1A: Vesicle transport through interaction with t-SNAREs homolog 1A (Homo sapiens) n=1 Tax=Cotesia congregata TaxID=51543 RepID=A0A8J2MH75_COTCN|nr:Similar to VTI1A: Vesicle transport through interaction with t-SNAREs homolog 1A (Homo sapiens) [Cotesia congregata]
MATLIDNYEQQYAVLTADITAKIGRINVVSGGEKRAFVQDVDRQLEEAQELYFKNQLTALFLSN